jgi:predicted PurR-regulated permease PerM
MTTEPTKAAPPSPETVVYAPGEAVASTVDEPLISPEIGQQVRTACLVVLALCVTGAALSQLGPILTPLLIALFLYFLFRPLAGFIPRLRISRWVAYPALFVAMLVAVQVVGEMVQSNARALEAKLPEYRDKLRGVIEIAARRLGHADPDGNYDWERALQDELARFKLRDVVSTTLGLVETTANCCWSATRSTRG